MARSMFSLGMLTARAESIASRRRGFPAGSPPPALAATVISRMILVQAEARRASVTAFLRLICFHLLWPAMGELLAAARVAAKHSILSPGSLAVQQILEPEPAPVEVEVGEPGRAVPVLEHDELRRALDAVPRPVHLLPIEPEHQVGVLLHRAARAAVRQGGPGVRPVGAMVGKLGDEQEGHVPPHRERLERAGGERGALLLAGGG